MQFMRAAKGSISIFLCIILLPMVTYSTMIIDASRLQASRSAIATAGDLAMNAALSEYEHVLEDMYGLFAVSQSEGEFKEQLKSYFAQTIEARIYNAESDISTQGIATDIVNAIFDEKPEEGLANLIGMQAGDVTYTRIDGSTLANQAIMKRQITEYMKYKGPVSLAGTLFSKLDFLKDSSAQTEVVKKKVEYTRTLDNIQDACEVAWEKLEGVLQENKTRTGGYANARTLYIYSGYEEPSTIESAFQNSKKYYEKMSACILMDKNSVVGDALYWNNLDIEKYRQEWGITTIPEVNDRSKIEDVEACMLAIYDAFNRIIDLNGSKNGALERYVNATFDSWDSVKDNESRNWGNSYNKISITTKSGSSGAYLGVIQNKHMNLIKPTNTSSDSYISELESFYNKQNAAYEYATAEWDNFALIKAAYSCISELESKYLYAFNIYDSLYEPEEPEEESTDEEDNEEEEEKETQNTEKTEAQKNYDKYQWYWLNMNGIYDKLTATNSSYKSAITQLFSKASDKAIYRNSASTYANLANDDLSTYASALGTVYVCCAEVVNALEQVCIKIEESETKKGEWQGKVDKVSSGTTKSTMQSDLDTTTSGMKIEDVRNLQDAVSAVQKQIGDRIQQLEGVVFFGYKVAYDSAAGKSSTFEVKTDVYRKLNDGETITGLAKTIVANNFNRTSLNEDIVKEKLIIENIDGSPEKEKFYLTLKSVCEPHETPVTSEQTESVEVINEASAGGNTGETTGLPSGSYDSKPEETKPESTLDPDAAKIDIKGIYNAISAKSKESGMEESPNEGEKKVTGATISTSKKDDYDGDAKEAEDSLEAANSILKSLSDIAVKARDYAYMEEYFTEMFTCRTHSKTGSPPLLNGYTVTESGARGINTNTPWYGKEIEYIMWGDPSLDANLNKTDAWIYVVRFALNAIYAFTAADIQAFALQLATAIAGWTVIGVPIVQACITIAIALAESAYDIVLLHDGEDVPIYKNAATFVCSPTGMVKEAGKKVADKLIEKGTDAVKNAINKKIDDIAEKGYSKIDDAMGDVNDFLTDYTTQQADSINTSIANQFVTPILNSLSPVVTEFDNINSNNLALLDDLVDNAIDTAMTQIKKNIDNMPDSVVKTLTLEVYKVAKEQGVSELRTKIKGYFRQVVDENAGSNALQTLSTMLISDSVSGDAEPEGIISKWIWKCKDSINKAVKDKCDQIRTKVHDLGDEGVGKIKSVLNEEVNSISAELSGNITKQLDNIKIDNSVSDVSTSGGFTLNYKEYCKIIVFVKLIAGQENAMLNRAATLIEANVKTAKVGRVSNFQIVNAYTLVGIKAEVQMGTLFPWGVEIDDSTNADGSINASLDLENLGENIVTINYQAVNGY